jgi:hypothetical protein
MINLDQFWSKNGQLWSILVEDAFTYSTKIQIDY